MHSVNKIQDILYDEQVKELGKLDELAIKDKNAIAARISLGVEMFIPPRDTHILYPQMETLLEDYYTRFSPYVNCYGSPSTGNLSRITSGFLTTMRNKLDKFNYKEQYNPYIFLMTNTKGIFLMPLRGTVHFGEGQRKIINFRLYGQQCH